MQLIKNPFADPAFDDVVRSSAQYVDQAYSYVFNTTIPASDSLLGQVVSLDRDADFLLTSLQIVKATSPLAKIQIGDNQGQLLSNDYIYLGAFLQGGLPVPFAFVPWRIFAAGGRILVNLVDESGVDNSVQIVFNGIKRYRI